MRGITFAVLLTAIIRGGDATENTTYDPAELLSKIFNGNLSPSARQAGYGLIRFEGQQNSYQEHDQRQYGLVAFDGQTNQPLRFEDQINQENSGFDDTGSSINANSGINFPDANDPTIFYNDNRIEENLVQGGTGTKFPDNGQVIFQDDNRIEGNPGQKRKKRRRRRKPRVQRPGYAGQIAGFPGPQGQIPNVPGYPTGQFYRPPRHKPQSIASEALTAVTGALTSIALYDDYQCVPRLLCEAAGGGALASGSGILQSIAGIQPLLTLLAAYNGISTSPLFVFGRAVFLGMTSKANPGTCRYAYPLCPTDTEQLVHYLNNHNGGFFRFFSAPQLANPQGQQNLEQFYNQLFVPGQYGLQPNVGNSGQDHYQNAGPGQLNYGLYSNVANPGQQNYGLYSNANQQFSNNGLQRPGLYSGYQQGYGFEYPYNQNKYGLNPASFKNNRKGERNKIEKRIQNIKQDVFMDNDFDHLDQNSKWMFPEDKPNNNDYASDKIRGAKDMKFPEVNIYSDTETQQPYIRSKLFNFPGIQSNRPLIDYYNYPPLTSVFNNNEYSFDNNGYITEDMKRMNNDDVEIVYVVRGNGDPKNPEIIKLRPGQTVQ